MSAQGHIPWSYQNIPAFDTFFKNASWLKVLYPSHFQIIFFILDSSVEASHNPKSPRD